MIDRYARKWAREHKVLLIEDSQLPEGTTFLTAERHLHFAMGMDLQLMMFHLNLTPEDKWFLGELKIGI